MQEDLQQAIKVLSTPGSVVLVPTETVYGLVCDWEDDLARKRIYELKGRSENKPLAMFAASADMAASSGVQLNAEARILLEKFAPGPITVIAPGDEKYPTVGVRIPDHEFIRQLLELYQRPLASTSANASGMPNVLTPAEAIKELHGTVDLVIDGGTLPCDAAASTVVTVCETPCRILRQGPVSEDDIKA
ncbi:MAG: threonylcarbamoyl-AMP synthase, partial [Lentisphaeria bacterium]|nr:threonylcarbamoyl-AMP synthase [Lentisphaeria bacterium]